MSYCRFSSDNWRSDIYCYESIDGVWEIHVAGNRVVGDIPPEPSLNLLKTDVDQFGKEHKAVMDFLDTAVREPIELPHAGESFTEGTAALAAERLLVLRTIGYNVPDYAIEALRNE